MVQAQTLIVAGSETTSTMLAGTTYYLLKNPQALRRLTEEVRGRFGSSEEIDADSTAGLPYLLAVVDEGLRIHTPAPFGLPRFSPGAVINGQYIPAGVTVSTSPWTMQHNDKYFADAIDFYPERWLPKDHKWWDEKFGGDVKDASKPFSIGPRACLGVNLALMEMRIILAKMTYHFDWELVNQDVNWLRDSQFKFLWKKPDLMVRFGVVN